MKMNFLVTGAAGFIGAAVAEKLVQEGNHVITIDNFSTGYKEHIPDGVELIEGNVADIETINKLNGEKFDAIVHIAGQSSGEISFENPVYDLQTNAQSTLLLLNYAQKIGCRKFIYASTMSVYGDHNPPVCDEETFVNPKSFYAVGKLASENYMKIYSSQYGNMCIALRLFNTYGIGQNMDNMKQGMASIYLAMAIKNRRIVVKGSKDRFRDFVYIDDVVNAFVKAIKAESHFKIYNVCRGKPITVEQVVTTICRKLPYDIEIIYEEGTPGDQFGIYGDNGKIVRELTWTPEIEFDAGMDRMIKWATSNIQ